MDSLPIVIDGVGKETKETCNMFKICLNIFETSSFRSFGCFCISANWLRIVRQELHFFACSPNWLKILFRLRKSNFFLEQNALL